MHAQGAVCRGGRCGGRGGRGGEGRLSEASWWLGSSEREGVWDGAHRTCGMRDAGSTKPLAIDAR
eukprot:scaffold80855_cov60-Phaeocystis_antarctica.AAC.1